MSAPGGSCQRQLPWRRDGVFMRAERPSPSRSCAETIAMRDGAAWASRTSAHDEGASSMPATARDRSRCRRSSRGRPREPLRRSGVVVRADVDQAVLVVPEPAVLGGAAHELELEHRHARQRELATQPMDGRGDHAEVLGDQWHTSEGGADRAQELMPGARRHLPDRAVRARPGIAQ